MTKAELRTRIRRLRGDADGDAVQRDSRIIAERVTRLPQFAAADTVFAYLDFNNEVMTKDMIKAALSSAKRVALPKVTGRDMVFYYIDRQTRYEKSRFGICEPVSGRIALPDADTLMIMPGLAFDRYRHRVGFGGGYYDRYLTVHTTLHTAAVAFSWQVFDEVPSNECDYSPDILITEKENYG